jgi:ABC-type Co2+ transport system permease subunit
MDDWWSQEEIIMHIQPGVVEGAQVVLSYATAAASALYVAKLATATFKADGGAKALALRSVVTTLLVLVFFQVLPHYPRGISEVHFIFGATLYLLFGAGSTAIGLAVGLLLQGLFFTPTDLPQYFINLTTLLVPLFVVAWLVKRLVPPHAAYVDLKLWQAFVMSLAFQGGIIVMVAFWAFYGLGLGSDTVSKVLTFGANYLVVIIVEPIVSIAVLAAAKALDPVAKKHPIFYTRLHHPVS